MEDSIREAKNNKYWENQRLRQDKLDNKQRELTTQLQISLLKREIDKEQQIGRSVKAIKPRNKYDKSLPAQYKSYLMRADQKGIPMELSVMEFEEMCNKSCTYCGQEQSKGIDRIESSTGYTKENTTPCCTKCNMMKYIYSRETFMEHVKKIAVFNAIV